MTNRFSTKVSEILAFSREEAIRLYSKNVGPEHLLLGLMRVKDGITTNVFNNLNIDANEVKTELESHVRSSENSISNQEMNDLTLNEQANNLLRLAVIEARSQRMDQVDEKHILMAILHDQMNNNAKRILNFHDLDYDKLNNVLAHQLSIKDGIGLPDEDYEEDSDETSNSKSKYNAEKDYVQTAAMKDKSKTPVVDNFSTDLTMAARKGRLDPVVGREKEILRLIEILGRRKKNNPILIGEPGVGKSAIVEGLAQLIADKRTSPILFNKRLVSLDMTSIVAGTKYRGQFEERLKALMKELENNPDIIVFMDEIHTIIGAGSAAGTMDAANILKPALARGTIQCIGATTLDEYRKSIEKDGALERRFQKIIVEPSTAEETLQILKNIKDRYEHHHHVTYSDKALSACVKLSERYITDRQFPDKAIDVMDEVGSKIHMNHATVPPEITAKEQEILFIKDKKNAAVGKQDYELAAGYRDRQTELESELEELNQKWQEDTNDERYTVGEQDVSDTVSMMTGVPVHRMAKEEGIRIKGMSDELKATVIAQDHAIEKMVKAIQRNRVGLKDPNHPIGVFMFLGPTGVGKTYLAKKLAEFMFGDRESLIRIDMSEFSESFNTSRLIGAPPGYVGYDEGGQLTERVRRHPYSIVLLDEIEKAHNNVFNMLLQVLDEGRLTDGNGRHVDFRNTVIIMTSNTGTRQLKEFGRGVGFNASSAGVMFNEHDKEHAREVIQKALRKQFSPEFLNRLDEIITFDQLDLEAIKKIVELELKGLSKRVEEIGYHISFDDTAKEFIAIKGYDVQFGARPLKRAIQNYVEDEISDLIVNGELSLGTVLTVTKDENADKLTIATSNT